MIKNIELRWPIETSPVTNSRKAYFWLPCYYPIIPVDQWGELEYLDDYLINYETSNRFIPGYAKVKLKSGFTKNFWYSGPHKVGSSGGIVFAGDLEDYFNGPIRSTDKGLLNDDPYRIMGQIDSRAVIDWMRGEVEGDFMRQLEEHESVWRIVMLKSILKNLTHDRK